MRSDDPRLLEDAIVPSPESQILARRQERFTRLAHNILNGRSDLAVLEDIFSRSSLAAWYMALDRCTVCDRPKAEGHICLFCRGDIT